MLRLNEDKVEFNIGDMVLHVASKRLGIIVDKSLHNRKRFHTEYDYSIFFFDNQKIVPRYAGWAFREVV